MPVDVTDVQVVVGDEVLEREGQAAVGLERRDALNQGGACPQCGTDVVEHVALRHPFEVNVAALGSCGEAVHDLRAHSARGGFEDRPQAACEVIAPVLLADEVQYGEALLPWGEPEATPELLEKDRERLRWA